MTRRQANALLAFAAIAAAALLLCAQLLARISQSISSIEGSQADQIELLKQAPGRQR